METKMGSPFNIVFYCDDSTRAANLARQCFSLVDSFVFIFSDYLASSELSKLSASAGKDGLPIKLSPALFDMLLLSKNAFEKSDGAFDITIGPLVKLWRSARKTGQFPGDETVQSTRSLIGFNKMIIDTAAKEARLLQKGMQLDLGGIAQGYIAQKIMDFLHTQNINRVLVNCSGDIVMSNAPPGTKGWVIGINVPETTDELLPKMLSMQNRAVTTSGDAYQFMDHAGKRYSHIIDPVSGYGVTFQRNVTVIADDGATADWLATACSILSVKKAKRLASQLGAELLISEIKKGRIKLYFTKGFARFWKQ